MGGGVAEPGPQPPSPGAVGSRGKAQCPWDANERPGLHRVGVEEGGRRTSCPEASATSLPAPTPAGPRTQDAEMSRKVTDPPGSESASSQGLRRQAGSVAGRWSRVGCGVTGFSHRRRAAPQRPSDLGSPDRACLGRGQSSFLQGPRRGTFRKLNACAPVGGVTRNSQRDWGQEGHGNPQLAAGSLGGLWKPGLGYHRLLSCVWAPHRVSAPQVLPSMGCLPASVTS